MENQLTLSQVSCRVETSMRRHSFTFHHESSPRCASRISTTDWWRSRPGRFKMLFGASVPAFADEPVRIDDHDLDIRRPGTTQNQELAIRQGEK